MNKYLEEILKEMCNRVGTKKIDFSQQDWYLQYTWTEKEEEAFRKWLIGYLKKNPKAKKELISYHRINSPKKFADKFIFNYGWKYERPN